VRDRRPSEPDRETLPAKLAERLLTRASELDATGLSTVTQLREAATEAGISQAAFDAALAELRDAEGQREVVAPPPKRSRARRFGGAIAAVVVAGVILTSREAAPSNATGVQMLDETIVLRCLAPDEATAIARTLLDQPENTLAYRERVLRVHGTASQIAELRAHVDRREAELPACTLSR
jgi:hypothetical protein